MSKPEQRDPSIKTCTTTTHNVPMPKIASDVALLSAIIEYKGDEVRCAEAEAALRWKPNR